MKNIELNCNKYVLEKNVNDCFNKNEVEDLMTSYFDDFDYILGDYAYEKLRLKGFCNKSNPRFSEINDINFCDQYIEDYCSYKTNYFLLKKIEK